MKFAIAICILFFATTVQAQNVSCPNCVRQRIVMPQVIVQSVPTQFEGYQMQQQRVGLFGWRLRWVVQPVYRQPQQQQQQSQ